MSVRYTIEAKPTLCDGVFYRSRLEATWAAFFKYVGWRFEYEPVDLGLWSPDFLLYGHRDRKEGLYVEVKPIYEFCKETAEKMLSACKTRELLLLGCGPFKPNRSIWTGDTIDYTYIAKGLQLGWLIKRHVPSEFHLKEYEFWRKSKELGGEPDKEMAKPEIWDSVDDAICGEHFEDGHSTVCLNGNEFWGDRLGYGPHKMSNWSDDSAKHIEYCWKVARNKVQYQPNRK